MSDKRAGPSKSASRACSSTDGNSYGQSPSGRGRGGYYGNRGSWRGRWNRGWRKRGGGKGRGHENPTSTPSVVTSRQVATPPPATPPVNKRPHLIQTTMESSQYCYWNTYLPNEAYTTKIVQKIKEFETFFSKQIPTYNAESQSMINTHRAVPIHYLQLIEEARGVANLSEEIKENPDLVLNCLGLAFHTVFEESFDNGFHDSSINTSLTIKTNEPIQKYNIRLHGLEPITLLRNIKAPLFGRCVSVVGTVVRVSSVKPLVVSMGFQCHSCNEIQSLAFTDGKYATPAKCLTYDCSGKFFTPLRRSSLTKTVDSQRIRLQEQVDDDRREAGRIPRTIDCEFSGNLVDSCVPGDVVTVTAIVKATSSHDDGRPRSSKDKCTFLLYLEAVSVVNSKNVGGGGGGEGMGLDFTTKDFYGIEEIHNDDDVFKLLVGSLCPTIYGQEIVKAGLLLGLFGGVQTFSDDKNSCISIRGNPHILVVGDPGLGKSQMLQAAANIAPRGVYVCGNAATSSGLTVTLTKEGGSSEYGLEAGALVLGDQGCCCIDEFDKMSGQHQALMEAMEQQSISIAKAGIVCTLPARTSILAAANPIGGHYNKAKTVSENLKMNAALLSRFDLVFILLDNPDEEFDSILSEHVMSLHSKQNRGLQSAVARRTSEGIVTTPSHRSILSSDLLSERLKVRRGEHFDPVPPQLLRKYIGYARQYIHPSLESSAAEVLRRFYLELRKQRRKGDGTPITMRQLESLIRLTEARARLELRDTANEQDAKDVVEIMKFSMQHTYSDEYGFLDYSRSHNGSGMSQKAQAKHLVSELSRLAERNGDSTFSLSQLRDITQRLGLQLKNFDDFIFSLNNQGYLLKKGPQLFKVQTAFD